jgi:hypothetical protein
MREKIFFVDDDSDDAVDRPMWADHLKATD